MLWRLSIATTLAAEDALGELVGHALGRPVCSYTDAQTGRTTVSVYFEEKPDLAMARAQVAAASKRIENSGLNAGSLRISLTKLRRADWTESWKRHFKPLELGPLLLIRPSWSRRKARKGQRVLVLDPGLSFGTGRHPTTEFCLHELAARRKPGDAQSFLDLGCGSGILAIAAAKLGYSPVHAVDVDPDAVRTACANARRNRVDDRITFQCRDVAGLPCNTTPGYAVICANLTSELLLAQRDRILWRLKADGVVALAGVLRSEFSKLQRAYEAAGLRLIASRAQKGWKSGSFRLRYVGKSGD